MPFTLLFKSQHRPQNEAVDTHDRNIHKKDHDGHISHGPSGSHLQGNGKSAHITQSLELESCLIKSNGDPFEIRVLPIQSTDEESVLTRAQELAHYVHPIDRSTRFFDQARLILECIPDGVLLVAENGLIRAANSNAGIMFGRPSKAITGVLIKELLSNSDPDHSCDMSALEAVDEQSGPLSCEMAGHHADGSTFPAEITVRRVRWGPEGSWIIVVHNISRRRKLEHDVLRISEEERQHIGQDIHDHLASMFSGLALMGRGLLKQRSADPDYRIPAGTIEYMVDQARSGAERARALARGLSPVNLEAWGVEEALRDLMHHVGRMATIECYLDCPHELPPLEPSIASELYRIAHEAVMNAMKHSGTERLEVTLNLADDTLTLRVRDFGDGLPDAAFSGTGMGIQIMKYRAGLIHASLSINPVMEGGTSVVCRLPLNR